MALTQTEREIVAGVIRKLSRDNPRKLSKEAQKAKDELQLWLDSWIIPSLEAVAKAPKDRYFGEMQDALSNVR